MPLVEISLAEVGVYSLAGDTKSPAPNIEFDLNQFRDPLGNIALRRSCTDGKDPAVQEWIKVDPRFKPILDQVIILVKDHFHGGGKWFSVGFRDHHGTWISRAVACLVVKELSELGYKAGVLHARGQD